MLLASLPLVPLCQPAGRPRSASASAPKRAFAAVTNHDALIFKRLGFLPVGLYPLSAVILCALFSMGIGQEVHNLS